MDTLTARIEAEALALSPEQRRMTLRLLTYWKALRGDRPFPSLKDFNVEAIPGFGPCAFLLDLTHGEENPVFRFVGKALTADGPANLAQQPLSAVPRGALLRRITDQYPQVLMRRQPFRFDSEYVESNGVTVLFRGILLPFSEDGERIDFIVGTIGARKVHDTETLRAKIPLEARLLDLAARGTGPGATPPAAPAAPAPAASPVPAPAPTEDHKALAPRPASVLTLRPPERPTLVLPAATLKDLLEDARTLAREVDTAEHRTRRALYRALASVLAFHEEAGRDADGYAALLAAAGLERQERAPLTPTVKLVFGADHDKTRISEYAAALAYAARHGQTPETLVDFLTAHPGGLKGCIAEERRARRAGRGEAPTGDPLARAARILRQAPALAVIAADLPGRAEFVLLLGRRSGQDRGSIAVIGAVEEKERALAGLLRRAARDLDRAARRARARPAEPPALPPPPAADLPPAP
jgi:hypothetical protein